MPIPRRGDDDKIKVVSGRELLVVMGTLGIELRRFLSGLLHQLARMLCMLRHDIANGEYLRILGQEPTEQTCASAANADEANARILGGLERDTNHCLARRRMLRIGKGIVVELEGRGHHGAKLQKLPPAGRKRKVG
jgi:hypothetical protein